MPPIVRHFDGQMLRSNQLYENLTEEDEVRLLILKPGEKTDSIECLLEHVKLSDKPEYEAVSYMWGTDGPSYPISINGFTEIVRANLKNVLVQLRRPHENRILWIDALCINQNNNLERNQQVALMQTIYSTAANVCISLGWEGSGYRTKHAEETFNFIVEVSEMVDATDLALATLARSTQHLVWVMNFFSLRYWKRLWILQEVVLAPNIEIYWAACYMSWETLQNFLQVVRQCAAADKLKTTIDMDRVIHSGLTDPVPYRLYLQRRQFTAQEIASRHTPIVTLIATYADAECADNRDRVFALLSFASGCCRAAVPADYTCTSYQLCNKLTRHHLQYHVDPQKVVMNETTLSSLNTIRRLVGEGTVSERPKEGYPHFFRPKEYLDAFFDSVVDDASTIGNKIFTVRGYLAATILETTPSLRSACIYRDTQALQPTRKCKDCFSRILEDDLVNCLNAEARPLTVNLDIEHFGPNLLAHEALFSIENIGRINHPRPPEVVSRYMTWPPMDRCSLNDIEDDFKGALRPPTSLTHFVLRIMECLLTNPGHSDCALFLADHDMVGIAPPQAQPGDKLLVFNGKASAVGYSQSTADVLAVVRLVNGKHEIVGRARLFSVKSSFLSYLSGLRSSETEFEIDLPGVILLSRATYNEPFLDMDLLWQWSKREEFDALKRTMVVSSRESNSENRFGGGEGEALPM
jgi:hypothetical protein